MYINIV